MHTDVAGRGASSDENRSMLEELGLTKVEVTENSNNITLRFRDGFVITYAAEAMKEEETEDAVVAAANRSYISKEDCSATA